MKIGIATIPSSRAAAPGALARAVEDLGFERLVVSEHTHIPAVVKPAYPGGGDLPEDYLYCCDPFTWLAFAAQSTSTLRVGTGVCLVPQHDVIQLAKRVATLDHLSGGRFEFGIGYGYNMDEAANHGVAPADRRSILREKMLAMRELWTKDVAAFEGDHVWFTPSWSWPKPAQRPHPPILMGAAPGPRTFEHIAEFCDGWMMYTTIDRADVERLGDAFERAGRPRSDVVLGVHRIRPDRSKLEELADLGADFVTLTVAPGPLSAMQRDLDALAIVAVDHLR